MVPCSYWEPIGRWGRGSWKRFVMICSISRTRRFFLWFWSIFTDGRSLPVEMICSISRTQMDLKSFYDFNQSLQGREGVYLLKYHLRSSWSCSSSWKLTLLRRSNEIGQITNTNVNTNTNTNTNTSGHPPEMKVDTLKCAPELTNSEINQTNCLKDPKSLWGENY